MAIDWRSPHVQPNFERTVHALLRSLYPESLRAYDGAGGDGGKDALLLNDPVHGRTVFEMKSFNKRLTSAARRQIKRSLAAAIDNVDGLCRWVLIVPLLPTTRTSDHRSSEEAWFYEELGALAGTVSLEWWGTDWLDIQFAANPAFEEYLLGVEHRLLKMAAELHLEDAVLADSDAAVGRLTNLKRRIDQISPFWTLDVAVETGGSVTLTVVSKHPDAADLDPIGIAPKFEFPQQPDDLEAAEVVDGLTRSYNFGTSAEVPARFVRGVEIVASEQARRLFGAMDMDTPGNFSIEATPEAFESPIAARMRTEAADGEVGQWHRIQFSSRTAGVNGVHLVGEDRTGMFRLEVDLLRPDLAAEMPSSGLDSSFNLQVAPAPGRDVSEVRDAYKLLSGLREGSRLVIDVPGLAAMRSSVTAAGAFPHADAVFALADNLSRMASANDTLYMFPSAIEPIQVRHLARMVQLLDGGTPELGATGVDLTFDRDALPNLLDSFTSEAPQPVLSAQSDVTLEVGDLTVKIPFPTLYWYSAAAHIANIDELRRYVAEPNAADPVVHLRTVSGHPLRWLTSPPDQGFGSA